MHPSCSRYFAVILISLSSVIGATRLYRSLANFTREEDRCALLSQREIMLTVTAMVPIVYYRAVVLLRPDHELNDLGSTARKRRLEVIVEQTCQVDGEESNSSTL